MGFKIGQTAGDYEFLRIVDDQSSTLVYQVRNLEQDRLEILKVLPRELREDRQRVERFLREAKIHAHLAHPHIAEFYMGFQLDGRLVMTTEYIDGAPLEKRLALGPIDMTEAIDIACQALTALDYSHRQKVVHREITPANLFLTADGQVKLTGFGLAKQAADPRLTQPGTVLGAVHYMSPEQVKGIELDGSSDLYSLGVVLYEMLTGAKPFDSTSQFDIFQAHVMTPPPDPTDFREDLPEELAGVVLQALEKYPNERFGSAAGFRRALEAVRPAVAAAQAESRPLGVRDPMEELDSEPSIEVGASRQTAVAPPRRRARRAEPDPMAYGSARRGTGNGSGSNGSSPAALAGADETDEDERVTELAPAAAKPSLATARAGYVATGETPEGWRVADLVMIGALTFVMVMAMILAGMIILDV